MSSSRAFAFTLINSFVLTSLLLLTTAISRDSEDNGRSASAAGYYERALHELVLHRRMFLDGFGNGTALLQRQYDDDDDDDDEQGKATADGEGRGRRKRLKQMNRTLLAIVMAFSLKFMFLIPTFVGTLILLKFTTGLAGFFYALFAAVLGLDHKHEH